MPNRYINPGDLTPLRFKSNAFTFSLKRTCVLPEMNLRFGPNALAFWDSQKAQKPPQP